MEVEGIQLTRRRMLMAVSVGASSLVAIVAGVPILGFFLGPVFRKFPAVWRDVGAVDMFKIGDVVQINLVTSGGLPWDGAAQRIAAWLRRDKASEFIVFSSKCTHLGCPVRWIAGAKLFMCPCHGGVYDSNGDVAAGPPPKPLQRFAVRVADGRVQVQWKPEWVEYTRLDRPCPGVPNRGGLVERIAPASEKDV